MTSMWQDVRFGVRVLIAHRQFTAVAVLVLALGIGSTTAVFSVVNAVLLRELPYEDPDRLVAITSVFHGAAAVRTSPVVPLRDVADWRARTRLFASMGAFAYTQLPMRVGDRSFSPITALMDPQFLPTLGNGLALGSHFETASGRDATAIISHALWVDAFASDPGVIGRGIVLDGEPYIVRGVLARGFQFPRSDASYFTKPVDLLIPSSSFEGFPAASRQWFGIARLATGVSRAQAEAELQSVAESLSRDASTGDYWSVRLTPLHDETTRRAEGPLLIVLGISIVLLLIAATNLMNLFFSRGVARLRELSIRRALGSSAPRLVRQLLVEAVLLAAAGGALGVWLAALAIDALVAMSPVHLPVTSAIDLDGTVLAFTTLVCLAAAMAAAFLPALHVSAKTNEAVRSPGMRTTASPGVARIQGGLCVAQIALGMALLAGAGLLSVSLWRLSAVDPGFRSDRVLGFNLSVPNDQSGEARVRFYAQALEEIRTIPGVEAAGAISRLPPDNSGPWAVRPFKLPGREEMTPMPSAFYDEVDPGALEAMGVPLLQGRYISHQDTREAAWVAVISRSLAERYFPGENPLGRSVHGQVLARASGTSIPEERPREIVGVVGDLKYPSTFGPSRAAMYVPQSQHEWLYPGGTYFTHTSKKLVIRTALDDPMRLARQVREAAAKIDSEQVVESVMTMESRFDSSFTVSRSRFDAQLFGVFGVLALVLAMSGAYGVMSYFVAQREREFGIRMALGADRSDVMAHVFHRLLKPVAVGISMGALGGFLFTKALGSQFVVRQGSADPLVLAGTSFLMALVATAAGFFPALHATRFTPRLATDEE